MAYCVVMSVSENIENLKKTIFDAAQVVSRDASEINLVAVSKVQPDERIQEALDAGHRLFGENRVQEAQGKWPELRRKFSDIELHLIGPLQSNKASDAVALFDCIQTVDREKIARAIANEMEKQNRELKLFVQVNTGSEPQKAGIEPKQTQAFCEWCVDELGLDIGGLMCIPPFDENPGPHFALLRKCRKKRQRPNFLKYLN